MTRTTSKFAVFFDMDGIIVDTPRVAYQTFLKQIKPLNIEFTTHHLC